ncbi:MAG: exodeoxyribonuclease large subunit [Dehalococcoidia bacterium]|nr:exodeoxyribonuclease large subunit [Dehalococcoidia bacterium]
MPVYSVSQVTRYLRDTLEADFLLRDLWVRGEVSNLSPSAAGHFYFTLKDDASQVRCVMFRPAHGGEHLEAGGAILAHGRISLYEVRGELQLYVDLVQPEGVGELHLELERLKVKLESEGLFQVSRKRPIPPFPQRIGVVTSPFGAVWHDIQSIIGRRYPLVELALAPTPVQGDGAAAGIVDAFDAVNSEDDIDVVILARGGGSLEELWPFNEEAVARAIYASRAPVISAVGHETDYTIADMVADCRAPTPSAAAELAVPDREEMEERILSFSRSLFQQVSTEMATLSHELDMAVGRLERYAPNIPSWRQRVDDLSVSHGRVLESYLALRGERVKALEMRLASLSPTAVLSRGYAVVQRKDTAELVTSVSQVQPNDDLHISVKDGSFPARVLERKVGDAV